MADDKKQSKNVLDAAPDMDTSEEGLLEAFNAQFKLKATAPIMRKMMGDKRVKAWYKGWKEAATAVKGLPTEWRDAGLTPAQWDQYQQVAGARKGVRSQMAKEMEDAAEKHRKAVASIEATAARGLAATDGVLVRVIELGYDDLSLAEKVSIESAGTEAERETALKRSLAALRKVALARIAAGEDPFS
jgi:hypothetical protein